MLAWIPLLAIASETESPTTTPTSGIPLWISILAIGALYGGLFYLWYAVKTQRGLGAWLVKQKSQREMKHIETLGIAPRTSAVLIEARGKPFIIVVSPNAVQIHPLNKDDSFEDTLDLETKSGKETSPPKRS